MYEFQRRILKEAAKYQKNENAYDPIKDGWEGAAGSTVSRDEPQPLTEAPMKDPEGEMALTQLKSIVEKANEIIPMLKPDSQLEAWVQSKITMADDYITTVRDYIKHTPGSVGD
jgi:serine protease inhibitor